MCSDEAHLLVHDRRTWPDDGNACVPESKGSSTAPESLAQQSGPEERYAGVAFGQLGANRAWSTSQLSMTTIGTGEATVEGLHKGVLHVRAVRVDRRQV